MKVMDTFVTTTAAARLLGVTTQTIRRMVRSGELPARRLENDYNGKFIIERSEVEHLKVMRELAAAGKAGK